MKNLQLPWKLLQKRSNYIKGLGEILAPKLFLYFFFWNASEKSVFEENEIRSKAEYATENITERSQKPCPMNRNREWKN